MHACASRVRVELGESANRFRLLEIIRQYAAEKMRLSDEENFLHDRHLAWYLALAEEADPAKAFEWLATLRGETVVCSHVDLVTGVLDDGRYLLFKGLAEWKREQIAVDPSDLARRRLVAPHAEEASAQGFAR